MWFSLLTSGGCVFFPWPSSCLAALLFALKSAAASSPSTSRAAHTCTHYIASTVQRCVALRLSVSLSLPPIFEPCLYSSRPRPCSCESWTKFFLPYPPSRTQPTRPAVPRPASYQLPALTAWSDGFTSYSADRLRRRSPIQPALYALPDRTSYTVCCCLSVCQSRTALIS